MKIKKLFRRAAAVVMAVATAVSILPSANVSAATGDAGTITFEVACDSNGNAIKYNSSATINGHTAGETGRAKNRVFVDGDTAFCIEPGVSLHSGDTLKEASSKTWKALSDNKKKAIGLALLYGYQGNKKNLKGSDDEKWLATQVLVWEFVAGSRKATGNFKRENTTVYHLFFGSTHANKGTAEVYDQIVDLMTEHNTIPSFMSEDKEKVLKDMKFKDGRYSITLTDNNKVLSDYTITCTDSKISLSVSGNKLTVTSTEPLDDTARIKAVRKNVPTVSSSAKLIAYGSDALQDIVTGVENADKVNAYVNVQTKAGKLALKKTSEDGIVAGISFTIKGEDFEKTVQTGNDGSITVEDMVPGTYTVTEASYDRYVPQQTKTVEVVGGKTATVTFSNILKKFNVTVTKKDVEKIFPQGDASLAGAVYGIYKGGNLVDTYTTDTKGQFTTAYYVCGNDWTIREISPSEGYLLDKTIYPVGALQQTYTVQYNVSSIDVVEDVEKGKIALVKHTDDGKTQLETPETGAEFAVFLKKSGSYDNAKEDERDYLICNEDGFAQTKDLPYGWYTVRQTVGWEGRELMKDFDVFINQNGKTYRFIINNGEFGAHVKIVKKDAETGKTIPYAGAGFQIYDPEGNLVTMTFTYPEITKIDTFYTTEDGMLLTPEKLPYGKGYSLVEVQAPYGYVLDSEPIKFDVVQDKSEKEQEITIIKVERPNMPQKGKITVAKTGEVFSSVTATGGGYLDENGNDIAFPDLYQPVYEDKGLEGAVYEVTAAEDIITPDGTTRYEKDTVVATITTGEDGTAVTEPLYLGKYEIREVTAPEGMVINDTVHEVELTYAGQEVDITETAAEFYNDRQRVEISLDKVLEENEDFEIGDNGEIQSVQFGLYAAEELVAEDGASIPEDGLLEIISCDEKGKAVFKTDVPVGAELYVKEYSTDVHYILSEETYPVEFEYAGQETALVKIKVNEGEEIENELIYGSIKGHKVDRETGENIAGAVFGLFSAKETEFTEETAILIAESDTNGVFGFEDVPFGNWVIRELKPAEGFLPNSENYPVAIAGDEQVVEIIVVNDRIPELGTTATVDGGKEINATEVFTLEDVVSYKHLIPGKEYVVNGVLMDKNTEKPLIIDGQEVHSEAVFTPEQPMGEVVVSFMFDAKFIKEDTSIVVFESLYKDGMELAVHADIEDENQTVKVRVPEIRTKATIDGKKKAEADKEITIVDTVTYQNLTPGKEYLVEGILMDKKTGKPYLVDGKEIRSEAAFVPEKKNGKIEIAFTFDGSGIKKDTDIVVFETLYRDMVELTAHADIEDKGQTVTIIPPAPIVPQTGDSSMTGLWLGLGAIALGGLISLLFIKKKKDEDYES